VLEGCAWVGGGGERTGDGEVGTMALDAGRELLARAFRDFCRPARVICSRACAYSCGAYSCGACLLWGMPLVGHASSSPQGHRSMCRFLASTWPFPISFDAFPSTCDFL